MFDIISNLFQVPNFDNATRDVFTASDSSIGNSGGTTEVKIRVHSKNNLYLFLVGSSLPVIKVCVL